MDKFELGRALIGRETKESALDNRPNAVSMIFADAVSDSVDGYVEIYLSGEYLLVQTQVVVKEGDEVSVSIVGTRPVVTGVVGGGDRMEGKIDASGSQYVLETNVMEILKFPTNIYIPEILTIKSYTISGPTRLPYLGTITVEVTVDGKTYIMYHTETNVSQVDILVSNIEAKYAGFVGARVKLLTLEGQLLLTVHLAATAKAEEFTTSNASGTYFHITPGPSGYNKGANVRLSSDGMQIRNNDTALATFTGTKVSIGQNSASSTIDLLNGSGTIDLESVRNTLRLRGKYVQLSSYGRNLGGASIILDENSRSSKSQIESTVYQTGGGATNTIITQSCDSYNIGSSTALSFSIRDVIQQYKVSNGTIVESSGTIHWTRYSDGMVIMRGRLIDTVTFSWASGLGMMETSKAAPRFKMPFTFSMIPIEFCEIHGNGNRVASGGPIGMLKECYTPCSRNVGGYSGEYYGIRNIAGGTGYLYADWFVIGQI